MRIRLGHARTNRHLRHDLLAPLALLIPLGLAGLAGCERDAAPATSASAGPAAHGSAPAAPAASAAKQPQPFPTGRAARRRGGRLLYWSGAESVKQRDRNQDGKLERSELPGPAQQLLADADKDGDGAYSAQEIDTWREARFAAWFGEDDQDSDGKLTEAEAGLDWKGLVSADANADGALTRDEFVKGHLERKLGPPGPAGEQARPTAADAGP